MLVFIFRLQSLGQQSQHTWVCRWVDRSGHCRYVAARFGGCSLHSTTSSFPMGAMVVTTFI
jgi:hypothetical protein